MAAFPALDSLGPQLPRDRWTLPDAVAEAARLHGEREFMSFEDGSRLTFASFDELTDRLATALAQLGLDPGDRLLALASNSAEFMCLMIATHKRRAVFVPVNTEIRGSFLTHQVRNAEPKIVACDADLLSRFDEVDLSDINIGATITTDAVAELLATEAVPDAVLRPAPEELCTIMYTSGTTGPAKGVMMPQAHCYLFGLSAVGALDITPDDRYFCCMPLFHANGLFMQVYASLLAGASVHCTKRFSTSTWLSTVREQGATLTNALGVMPEFIYRSEPTSFDRDHQLRTIVAIPVAADWAADFERRFGVRIAGGFGMTEVNLVCYTDLDDPVEAGLCGPVLSEAFEVIVAEPDTDRELPDGEIGEILVRPKLPFCFNVGYYKMPEKTADAARNLWFHTGDAGRFDERGRLYYVDRLNDRIRRRGENISSYEIEQVLNSHPAIVESAVVGVRVEGAGNEDEIKAVLALSRGATLDPVELLDWATPQMPRHSVPRFVEFTDELPTTASGKVQKQRLRDAGVGDATWDRESVGYTVARG